MKSKKSKFESVIVLDNIRSIHNVGAIFRTSDALGIDLICLCGITPSPTDRFGRERNDFNKAALGAQHSVSWKHYSSALECVTDLKTQGYSVVCVEQHSSSIDYKKVSLSQKTAFVFGNEVDGISPEIISIADHVAEIDMHGIKESLNVSVVFGIVMFRILDN